jgi:ribonuclease BN (tRNA processing enzyme)
MPPEARAPKCGRAGRHSTGQEGARLCRLSGAKRLALYHHAPHHTDEITQTIEQQAKAEWNGVSAVRQGSVVET